VSDQVPGTSRGRSIGWRECIQKANASWLVNSQLGAGREGAGAVDPVDDDAPDHRHSWTLD
jgi:hypothetical protein